MRQPFKALADKILLDKKLPNKQLFNGVLFQMGWFACVLGGDAIALLALAVFIVLHGLFFVEKKQEWFFIAGVVLAGFAIDSLLSGLGIFLFELPSAGYIPLWLLCLWFIFATTLNHSLVWLQYRLPLAALLGAISGPTSYFAGSKLAAVTLADPLWLSILVISVCWAILLPVLFLLSRRITL